MWQKLFVHVGLLAGLTLGWAPAGVAQTEPAQTEPVAGDMITLPAVTLIDGRKIPEGYYQGKPVVIEYWASWCPFCARQNPYVQKLVALAGQKGLEILTISIDRHESDVHDYIEKHHYTFPVAMETPELIKVFGRRKVIPQIFVVTADGTLAESIPGEMFEEDVLELIKYAPNAP